MNEREINKAIDKFNLLKNAKHLCLLKVERTSRDQAIVCMKSGDVTLPIAKILSDKEVKNLRPILVLDE
tara:strand:- start:7146 stop:7352 length:207 start_codon:yes stop_codon:yes gene_type:complete